MLNNSNKMDYMLSFSIQKLLLLCWMTVCYQLMLSICLKVLSWHANDAYQRKAKMGLSDTTSTCTDSKMT